MKMNYKFIAPLIVVLGLAVWLINLALARFLFNGGATSEAPIYSVPAHIIQTLAVVLAALIIFAVALSRLLATRRRLESELREKEERYRCLFEQAPIGIGTATLDGKVLEANQSMTDMTGYSLEELRSINLADTYENQAERQRLLEELNREGRVTDYSVRLRRKDGTSYDALLNIARVNMDGHSVIQTTQLDITELRHMEAVLKTSEQNFRNSLDSSPLGVLIFTADGELLYANQALLDIYGYSSLEELRATPAEQRRTPESFADYKEKQLRRIRGEAVPASYEISIIRKDGQVRHLAVFHKEVVWGGQTQFQTLYQDITKQKQAQQALRESEEMKNAVLNATPDFVAVVDKKGIIFSINEAMAKRFGKHPEELIGANGWRLISPELAESRKRYFEKVFQTGQPCRFEDESEGIYFDNILYPILEEQGQVTRIALSARNITEQKQAEEEYKTIVKTAMDGFWLADMQGRLLDVNDAYCQLIGYSRGELLKMNISDIEAIEKPGETAARIAKIRETGQDRFETRHRCKDGRIVDVEISVNYIGVGGGRMFVFIRDITERKQAEELYAATANSSPVGVYIVQHRKCVFVNSAFRKATGFEEEELLGRDSLSLVHPEDREKVRQNAVEMLKGKRLEPYEFRSIIKTGETKWALESVTSIVYRGKRATLGNFMDITERKQAEEKERLLEEELGRTARLAAVGELAAGVAHELNNPLTGILGFSERLLRKSTDEQTTRYLERINGEAARAAKVVQNLLTFARRQPPKKTYVDINEIVLNALELRAYELHSGGVEVSTALTPDLPKVLVDFQQIQQVFLNIIINAEQAMNEAKVAGRLAIETLNTGGSIQISFSDGGPGISEEYLGRIFDPFFTTRADHGGTGLGLSISYGILAEHGGRIYARSQPGRGATFLVELPVR